MSDAASDFTNRLSELTLEEKASLCLGSHFWYTAPVERLGIPLIMVSDGPHGSARPTGARRPRGTRGQRTRDVLPNSLSARLLLESGPLPNDRCGARQGSEEARRLGRAWAGESI